VTLFHFRCAEHSDHANEISPVELPENRLLFAVTEEGSNRLAQKGHVIFGRCAERQGLYFQRFPTERDEDICVCDAKPPDVKFHIHFEARFKLPNATNIAPDAMPRI
jgi:hypothetical protein